jgi:hypothetical protein
MRPTFWTRHYIYSILVCTYSTLYCVVILFSLSPSLLLFEIRRRQQHRLTSAATRQWSRALPGGQRPSGRYGHSLNIVGSKIYIFGGQVEGFFMNDISAFDLNQLQMPNNRWEVLLDNADNGVAPTGKVPPARTNHSMITHNDKLYL